MDDTNADFAVWRALFNNGKSVDQKDWFRDDIPEDQKMSYDTLDRENLVEFQMLRPDGSLILTVPFKPTQGGQLIWRRRVQMHSDGTRTMVYIVGKRGAFVAVITPSYEIIIDNNFDENNALLNDIERVGGEE